MTYKELLKYGFSTASVSDEISLVRFAFYDHVSFIRPYKYMSKIDYIPVENDGGLERVIGFEEGDVDPSDRRARSQYYELYSYVEADIRDNLKFESPELTYAWNSDGLIKFQYVIDGNTYNIIRNSNMGGSVSTIDATTVENFTGLQFDIKLEHYGRTKLEVKLKKEHANVLIDQLNQMLFKISEIFSNFLEESTAKHLKILEERQNETLLTIT